MCVQLVRRVTEVGTNAFLMGVGCAGTTLLQECINPSKLLENETDPKPCDVMSNITWLGLWFIFTFKDKKMKNKEKIFFKTLECGK